MPELKLLKLAPEFVLFWWLPNWVSPYTTVPLVDAISHWKPSAPMPFAQVVVPLHLSVPLSCVPPMM
jgi:hypothetical protein